jgi:tetratricopeptide (TPR) repeat protein
VSSLSKPSASLALKSSLPSEPDDVESVFAGRYRVESLLGTGGMGAVHLVFDQVTHRRIALKRLRGQANSTQRRLFEREYHTLASLKHPGIIEVYDYGIADGEAYYTMELLEGSDLRELAPMPWVEACRCLRDLASILGVLHARRLLHRDLSPRNVWRNVDGSIKLLDFGALSSFGIPRDISGTAAFIPPEAMQGAALDQRADLYMLGALGYWLISGSLAFNARQLGDLFEAWKHTPASVSSRVIALGREDLAPPPAALDALIDSLLSPNAATRPENTAELVDALSELAGLPRVSTLSAGEGYIQSKAFVGRERERDQLLTHLNTAASGVGGSFVYEAPAGAGRTRLLEELALNARLSGASVLALSAASFDGPYGLARGLALALLDAMPEEALAAARPFAPVLGHLSPEMHARLGGARLRLAALSEASGERRVRTQAALRDWFLALSQARLTVIAVDDVQLADDGSAAFLTTLGDAAKSHKLLLLATLPTAASVSAPVQALRQLATRVALPPLSPEETTQLLRSVFDEVPNLARLSERLQRVAQGNPAYCMELAEHLVREGSVRYVDGGWLLPTEVNDAALPTSRDAALGERLTRLGSAARALARMLSVETGPLDEATCLTLSPLAREATLTALEELVQAGVLLRALDSLRFSHPVLRETLSSELDAKERQRAHALLGQQLLARGSLGVVEQLEAGVHLMLGGDEQRGAAMVVAASTVLTGADALIAGTPLLEQALALFRAAGRSQHEQLMILARLATAAYYVDRKLAPYGYEAMSLLEDVFKLRRARQLSPWLGRKLSIILVLAWCAIGFALRKKNPLVPTFRDAMSLFLQAVSTMTGVATVCIDPDRATRYASMLEPFTALGRDHVTTLVYEFCMGLAATVRDRPSDASRKWQELLARLTSPVPIVGMPEDVRKLYVGGALYACGVLECMRDSSKALEYAEQLATLDMTMYEMSADQLRTLYYANQGNLALFEQYRRRVEMHAIQRGSAWQVETWSPGAFVGLYLRTGDALGMKRAVEELKRLRREIPSFQVYLERSAGSYLLLRGKHAEALTELSACLKEEPLSVIGWARSHSGLARSYNALGEHERARTTCERALTRLAPEDLAFTALNLHLQIEHAMARMALGEHEAAARDIDALLEQHDHNQGPLTLGALNEARARMALAQGDYAKATDHLLIMESWYRPTGIATLMQRCARLAKELRAKCGVDVTSGTYELTGNSTSLERLFTDVATVTQCAERVLGILAADTNEAYLYVPDAEGVRLAAARSPGATPPTEIASWLLERVKAAAENDNTVLLEEAVDASLNTRLADSKTYTLTVLYAADAFRDVVVGATVMVRDESAMPLKPDTVAALCGYLYKAQLAT